MKETVDERLPGGEGPLEGEVVRMHVQDREAVSRIVKNVNQPIGVRQRMIRVKR